MPPRDLEILKLLRRYYYLRARQVQGRLLPHDDDCAITRSRLRRLIEQGLVRKHQPKMVDPFSGNNSAAPIYTITAKGASMLVAEEGDNKQLLAGETGFGQWLSLNHYCSLSSLHMIIDDALAGKSYVKQTGLYFEHELLDPEAKDLSKRYVLHTTVSKPGEKPLFFCPDSAFETEVKGHRRAWMTEYETGSDVPRRVVAKKHKGVAGFAAGGHLTTIFPQSRDFRVIAFCPNAGWRDALRREFVGKPGHEFWLFCSTLAVKTETFLHESILFTSDKGPFPFLPRPS